MPAYLFVSNNSIDNWDGIGLSWWNPLSSDWDNIWNGIYDVVGFVPLYGTLINALRTVKGTRYFDYAFCDKKCKEDDCNKCVTNLEIKYVRNYMAPYMIHLGVDIFVAGAGGATAHYSAGLSLLLTIGAEIDAWLNVPIMLNNVAKIRTAAGQAQSEYCSSKPK